ncbi:hypothetical protein M878_44100 [Streptomyces roseochromogenus subsp. oscitans DS 12.976]|uniref:Uncharacterized protein n=1 Tax=Streptomyces roseochromogenus subsp. oscitans DS 12.976 TaxID=1352936 RepID=V6JG70_STRRC|nr:hypothetical protein M878_44100 [Streptomyces roseochromogenus subsp. oscitans DS 12.976]
MGDGGHGPFVGWQVGSDGCGQWGDGGSGWWWRASAALLRVRSGIGVGCLAGFQGDGIGGESTGLQGRGKTDDEVFVRQMGLDRRTSIRVRVSSRSPWALTAAPHQASCIKVNRLAAPA